MGCVVKYSEKRACLKVCLTPVQKSLGLGDPLETEKYNINNFFHYEKSPINKTFKIPSFVDV